MRTGRTWCHIAKALNVEPAKESHVYDFWELVLLIREHWPVHPIHQPQGCKWSWEGVFFNLTSVPLLGIEWIYLSFQLHSPSQQSALNNPNLEHMPDQSSTISRPLLIIIAQIFTLLAILNWKLPCHTRTVFHLWWNCKQQSLASTQNLMAHGIKSTTNKKYISLVINCKLSVLEFGNIFISMQIHKIL